VSAFRDTATARGIQARSGDARSRSADLLRVQRALLKAHIPIYLSYNGISKHSVAVVVEGERFEEAVRLLHAQLIDVGT